VLPRVFDPLFSTKTYGVGLGLPTVRQIVHDHGGQIELISEAGKGTEARISLPMESMQLDTSAGQDSMIPR
jgi:signal transduction histidine kinase